MQSNNSKKNTAYSELKGFRRAIPVIVVALAVFLAFCFIIKDMGAFGRVSSKLLLGLFSSAGYSIPAFMIAHAVFYPSDYKNKRTLTRIILSSVTVIAISALVHTLTTPELSFNAAELYTNGQNAKGGGFIGGAVAFALIKVFGKVGFYIIVIALFAIYLTYYFSRAKTLLLRGLLKILNAVSDFFTSIGERQKVKRAQKDREREEHRREKIAAEHEQLTDDEFFTADNGLKELKISELGINEVKDDAEIERNPHLHEKVHKDPPAATQTESRSDNVKEPEDPAPRRRVFNMDYSTDNSKRPLHETTKDSHYESKPNDIIYDAPEETPKAAERPASTASYDSDSSADSVFSKGFEPFDFKINEELSNKPSSKATVDTKEPPRSSEITESVSEITEDDIQKARQRADLEMKRRAALDAEKRFEEAKAKAAAEAEEIKRRAEEAARLRAEELAKETAAASSAKSEAQVFTFEVGNRADAEDENAARSPYIPEYMKEPVRKEIEKEPEEDELGNKNLYKLTECFAKAINEYENQRKSDFAPYTPPTVEDTQPKEEQQEPETPEELKISRTMLDPTPAPSETIGESAVEDEDDEYEFDSSSVEEFDSYREPPEEDEEEDEEPSVFSFSEEDREEGADTEDEQIPPHLQNADVIEQRNLFRFLDDEKEENEEASIDEPTDEVGVSSEDDVDESADDAFESEEPPFDVPKERSTFSERMMKPAPAPQPKAEKPAEEKPDYSDYQFPSVELLAKGKFEEDIYQEEEKNQNAEKLVDALSQFNVRISIKGIDRGPRITRYEIVPARGVKVNSVTNLFNDIALSLGVEGMRMEAPIPGKSAIGVEIPNKKPSTVLLRDLVESDEFICSPSKTMSCLGKDVTGNPVFADIAKMPHVLVAGATGMGKSVCINAILISILYKARPDEVKFIMIDPKKVEFNGYNGIPHLLIPVVTDVKQAAGALMWAVEQMEKRYDLMEALEVRKLDAYNDKVREDPSLGEPLPKIIIVIDELNDIMLQVRKPAEDLIMSIAQKARAAGIHLIIGTQRPSVDVITGVIKANIPSRISCKVASYNDSKTILEQAGAEKLLNNGDMLYISAGAPKALRVQGAYVSDGEVSAIMKFLKTQAKGSIYDAQALEEINKAAQKCSKGKGDSDDDDDGGDDSGILNDQQFLDAVDLAIKSGKIATSLLQRRIGIGYGKAAKFIDYMEDMGIVSEPNGQKPRDVLITKDEWHEMLSRRSLD